MRGREGTRNSKRATMRTQRIVALSDDLLVALARRVANSAPVVTDCPVSPECDGVSSLSGTRRTVRLIDDQIDRLLKRYQAGQGSVRELAEEFGIDRSTLLLYVQRAGLPKRNESTFWNEAELARAVERYEAGALCREIAVEMGVSKSTVARRLQLAGVNLRGR